MKNFKRTLWITFVFIFIKNLQMTDSFQCFECENCPTIEGDDKLVYIKDCDPIEYSFTEGVESSSGDGFISTTSSMGANSTQSSSFPSSTSSSTLSQVNKIETAVSVQVGDSTTKSILETTTEKSTTTDSWLIFPKSKELIGSHINEEPREDSGVCYVMKFSYEGSEITKRGCGLAGQNKKEICEVLGKNKINFECDVCEGSLCNSGSRFSNQIIGFVLTLLLVKMCILF